MENINSWKDIKWTDMEQRVFRLQLRIYKASTNDEFDKMYKLQKLLISSQSAKFLAVKRVTQDNASKRTPGVDKVLIIKSKDKFELAKQLKLDGRSSPILITYIPSRLGKERPLGIPTIEDRAKQMLAYLALCPQWEARFELSSYGFRPGRSILDAIEGVFTGISKKPKWVLDADIAKCLDKINYQYLLNKCNTYPEMRQQIWSWLKAGILDGEEFAFPEMGRPQNGIISPLLANITMHGLQEKLDEYLNRLGGHTLNNRKTLCYVRYADDFVIMHPDKDVLRKLKEVTQRFLEPIGLELHPIKTQIVHTYQVLDGLPPGFSFLGFDVVQKKKWTRMRKATTKQKFITLITPSKESVKRHMLKIREIIRRYRGASQIRLIQKLNPIIRGWALSKRTQISSRTFQDLDRYILIHLWKWVYRRHPKMSKYKLKEKYWHKVDRRNWVFGVKKKEELIFQLQAHSKISIQRHAKVQNLTEIQFTGQRERGKTP
jgi:RNA-directed DNA polymerase